MSGRPWRNRKLVSHIASSVDASHKRFQTVGVQPKFGTVRTSSEAQIHCKDD